MMRGPRCWAVAVRRPDGRIWVEDHPLPSPAERNPIFKLPLLRGVSVLGDSLRIGMRAMGISAHQSMPDQERMTRKQVGGSIAFSVILFIGIFIILPNVLSNIGESSARSNAVAALKEGGIRLGIFVGYILLLSTFRDVRRLFQYHGAEHQTIHAYESGEQSLSPEAVMRYPTEHVRCGTNFLIITVLLTLVAFSLLGRPAVWIQIVQRVVGLFLIAGVAYEFLRLGAVHGRHPVVRALMRPGLWLQRVTTKQPTPEMVEVAVRSFERVIPEEHRGIVPAYASPLIHPD